MHGSDGQEQKENTEQSHMGQWQGTFSKTKLKQKTKKPEKIKPDHKKERNLWGEMNAFEPPVHLIGAK